MALNENAKRWVAALRSGIFKQASGRLKTTGGGFCCLGLACELAEMGEWNYRRSPGREDPAFVFEGERFDGMWPKEVGKFYDVPNNISKSMLRDRENNSISLSEANDTGCTFNQIADLIEYFEGGESEFYR